LVNSPGWAPPAGLPALGCCIVGKFHDARPPAPAGGALEGGAFESGPDMPGDWIIRVNSPGDSADGAEAEGWGGGADGIAV